MRTAFPDVCKDCKPPERNPDCHSYCEKYLTAKAKHEAENERIKEETKGGYDAWNLRRESIEKTKREAHDRKDRK